MQREMRVLPLTEEQFNQLRHDDPIQNHLKEKQREELFAKLSPEEREKRKKLLNQLDRDLELSRLKN